MEWLWTSFQCIDSLLQKYLAMAGNMHLRKARMPREIKETISSMQ